MPTNFKFYLYTALAIVLLFAISWVYRLYQENQLLKFEKSRLQQNEFALRDSLGQVADSLTKTTAFVRNLNGELKKKTNEYLALEAKFYAFVNTINDSGNVIPTSTDSTVKVSFSGEKSIATYSGYTLYNTNSKSASWDLSLAFPKPIEIGAGLVEDSGVWKFRTWSLVPGVTVKGTGVLDDDTYRRLQKYSPPEPMKRFMVKGVIGQHGGLGAGYRADNWNFSGHYDLFNRYSEVLKNIYIDIGWCPF